MKFLADMGISPRTVEKLRREGYDAVHLVEERLEKLEDRREILTKARDEGRIILTLVIAIFLESKIFTLIPLHSSTF